MGRLLPMGEHFGRWLRARRESLGLSTRALGELAGCSHNAIARFEHGETTPTGELRDRIAKALGAERSEAITATLPDRIAPDEVPIVRAWLDGQG